MLLRCCRRKAGVLSFPGPIPKANLREAGFPLFKIPTFLKKAGAGSFKFWPAASKTPPLTQESCIFHQEGEDKLGFCEKENEKWHIIMKESRKKPSH